MLNLVILGQTHVGTSTGSQKIWAGWGTVPLWWKRGRPCRNMAGPVTHRFPRRMWLLLVKWHKCTCRDLLENWAFQHHTYQSHWSLKVTDRSGTYYSYFLLVIHINHWPIHTIFDIPDKRIMVENQTFPYPMYLTLLLRGGGSCGWSVDWCLTAFSAQTDYIVPQEYEIYIYMYGRRQNKHTIKQ